MEFTLVRADGSQEIIWIEPGRKALSAMQNFVGGLVEIVKCPVGRLMILNEEGKIECLPLNPMATAIYGSLVDYIVGDVLLVDEKAFIEWDKKCWEGQGPFGPDF